MSDCNHKECKMCDSIIAIEKRVKRLELMFGVTDEVVSTEDIETAKKLIQPGRQP
jgi:hypothetical protein